MSWDSLLTGAIGGAIVSYFLGPRTAWRQEAARRDRVARTDMAQAVMNLKHRMRRAEVARRHLEGGGQSSQHEVLTPIDFYKALWPVARSLNNPDLDAKVRDRVRSVMDKVAGASTVEYLMTCETAEQVSNTRANVAFAVQTANREEPLQDELFKSGYSSEPVTKIVTRLDKILEILAKPSAIPWM